MNEQQLLEEILDRAIDITIEETKKELISQGHNASGSLLESLEGETNARNFSGRVLSNFYWIFLDTGTKPHTPPFDAIYEWSKHVQPALSDNERRGFSWGVVMKIKNEGTPTSGSYKYSQNGRRKEFAKEVIDAAEERIAVMIEDSRFVEFILERAMVQSPK